MDEEIREFIVPIRMNYTEKYKIKKLADKAGKKISTFIRDASLGIKINEKPDKKFYEEMKQIGKFIRTLDELERIAYHKKFIDERILNEEIIAWRKFRTEIKERYL